ncbi:MAG TPA: tRNA (adenosine(37)-N6)-threonylcarbamoyltransferase complex dimerization subunit type 1 TsaB [Propionibacteriaceae bacterium]|nr:tRNA (adenosine(37)-N6)-threonylcarbamoyltransferase complex dimerization subunit type 1 TsaB [Propionibacteriaceae bacterium]
MAEERVVLAIDTSTVVNVGLARGTDVLATATLEDRMAHVEQLTPLIRDCLAQAGLRLTEVDQIVVGLGPGPFTGLRVGIVTAQTVAAVGGQDLHGICSLDVLAAQYADQRADQAPAEFVVATDARRREVYWAAYAADGRRLGGPQVGPPLEVPRRPTVGPAAVVYPDQLMVVPGPLVLDRGVLATAGPGLPDAGSTPLYLRRPDATEPTRRKSVLPLRARGVRR